MLIGIISTAALAISIAACTGGTGRPQSDLALQCELVKCECQDPADPFSRSPVVWNPNGTAACADGRRLVMAQENPSAAAVGGIVVPTYDACAHSGPRSGAGRVGRGARITDCGF